MFRQLDNRAGITTYFGKYPAVCAEVSETTEMCTWRLGNRDPGWEPLARSLRASTRVSVVCELPRDGSTRAPDSCNYWAAKRGSVSPSTTGRGKKKAKESRRREAQETLDAALTFPQLVALLGQGPSRCQVGPEERTCLWKLDAVTPGYLTVARTVGKRKRLDLTCRLPNDGGPRMLDACTAAPSVRPGP